MNDNEINVHYTVQYDDASIEKPKHIVFDIDSKTRQKIDLMPNGFEGAVVIDTHYMCTFYHLSKYMHSPIT